MKVKSFFKFTFFIFFLIGNFIIVCAATYTADKSKTHRTYKGVKFVIPGVLVAEYNKYLSPEFGLEIDLNRIPKPQYILENLSMQFDEALSKYESNKAKLPSCLSTAIDNFLMELMTGKRTLKFLWIKGRFKWTELRGDETGAGEAVSEKLIHIFTAFKRRYSYVDRRVLTASLIFHELIHSV